MSSIKKFFCNSESSIPEIDDTSLPCDGIFTDGDCITLAGLSTNVKTYFSLGDTPTLTEYAEALALSVIDARQRIITLENSLNECCSGAAEENLKSFYVFHHGNFFPTDGVVNIYQNNQLAHTLDYDDLNPTSTDGTSGYPENMFVVELDINKNFMFQVRSDSTSTTPESVSSNRAEFFFGVFSGFIDTIYGTDLVSIHPTMLPEQMYDLYTRPDQDYPIIGVAFGS